MINWFEVFAEELAAIRESQKEIHTLLTQQTIVADANPYGSFKWLCDTCADVPPSTLRIKSAAGEIPGLVKFGKRVLYEKTTVLNWLRSQTRQTVDMAKIEQTANQQLNTQLHKRSQKERMSA